MSLSFTFVDLLVIGTILVSAGYAAWRGLVSETLSIIAWGVAALATLWFGPAAVPLAKSLVESQLVATIIAYAGVFLVVLIPLQFVSHRFAQRVQTSTVGPLDRALGAAFGVVRGLAIIGFAYLILDSFVKFDNQPNAVKTAKTLPLMQGATEVILSLVPRHRDRAAGEAASGPAAPEALNTPQAEAGSGDVPASASPATTKKPVKKAEIMPRLKPEPVSETKAGNDATAKSGKKPAKTYGARDRRALDTLLETTGGNQTP